MADWREHITLRLLVAVLGLHDKTRLRVSCLSLGPPPRTPSELRQSAQRECPSFVDLSGTDDGAAAAEASAAHILLDANFRKGLEPGARNGVLARAASPLKLNFLARAEWGLPLGAPLLAITGNPAKLGPDTLTVAAAALLSVRRAALVLVRYPMRGGAEVEQQARLEAELAARGAALRRVRFLPLVPTGPHLRRSGLADLHLDTLPYNAHSTAVDCTYTAVPHLTLPGEQMAARLAAALLRAAGVLHTTHATLRELEGSARQLLTGGAW